ncbi:MAG: glycosyltransferase [Dongiaceae bacterium]
MLPTAGTSVAAAPLRVLHAFKVYAPEIVGGIPEVIRTLAAGLAPACDSRLLVARLSGAGRRDVVGGLPVRRVASLGTRLSMPLSPTYPAWLWAEARRADLVAVHSPFPLIDLSIALWFPARTALVVHWHSEIVGQRALLPVVAPLIRRALDRADRIIVSNEAIVRQSPFLRPREAKCRIVPFGIDIAGLATLDAAERDEVAALRARHPRLVLAVGRLVRYKGFETLIEAMRAIDGELALVGAGTLEPALRRQAASAGVGDRVHFAGQASAGELKRLLHACRVFALPSVSANETFAIAQLEAMACGRPVVNTRLPTGVPWVARHGQEALTVAPGSAPELAAALGRLLDDEALAAALGAAGAERARALFGLDAFLDGTLAVYREALAARRDA